MVCYAVESQHYYLTASAVVTPRTKRTRQMGALFLLSVPW
jgi:hypothetical protein